ncbi:dihydrofolate reductase family protein [uncultured Nocardioides sp.]|uniref:dihydrofolate reductase family protein n=1 Tax=uncultured Nocardioides sp. TaxID=198441 RepID=UPI002606ACF4|nr:dihydrofolate reductase family protein [uncultured Nocardioides sp.]HRD62463.1 dihydrofolate reductase family protein [Nocardioides sp.]
MRVLSGSDLTGELSDAQLDELYAASDQPWLRVNMISTVDGAATGADGKSGGINNDADHRVFEALRRLCDVVLVGAGTAREEGYRDLSKPLVLVSRRGAVPPQLRDAEPGTVLMATCAAAELLDDARATLGEEQMLVLGHHRVDLAALKQALVDRGWTNILSEGGPHLLRDLLAEGVVDEVNLTVVPRVLGGLHPRITDGAPVDVPLRLALLLEDEGTLLGRWLVD